MNTIEIGAKVRDKRWEFDIGHVIDIEGDVVTVNWGGERIADRHPDEIEALNRPRGGVTGSGHATESLTARRLVESQS